jgi:hypothetical protein
MIRPPRMTVALLMAAVAVVALVLGVVHRREMRRESDRRARKAEYHDMEARSWDDPVHRGVSWGLLHKAAVIGPTSSRPAREGDPREADLYILGYPPYASGRSYRDLGQVGPERGRGVYRIMAAFHRTMAEKWRQASRSPGAQVKPDPSPPLNIDVGEIWIQ